MPRKIEAPTADEARRVANVFLDQARELSIAAGHAQSLADSMVRLADASVAFDQAKADAKKILNDE